MLGISASHRNLTARRCVHDGNSPSLFPCQTRRNWPPACCGAQADARIVRVREQQSLTVVAGAENQRRMRK
jgi:hypothetical protein